MTHVHFLLRSARLWAALLLVLSCAALRADDEQPESLNRYLAQASDRQSAQRGSTTEVDIVAKLPKLKKEGEMHAVRLVSPEGKVSYESASFTGDNTVKKEVIARYLTAETQPPPTPQDIGIHEGNYKFKDKGLIQVEGRSVRVLQLSPRKKRVGLIKGELWLDEQTGQPVREAGRLVKNPSVFLKRVEFVREYEVRDGQSIPKRIESTVDTRLVGKAEMVITFRNFTREPAAKPAVTATALP